jgi:molecular chaperone Hsp33
LTDISDDLIQPFQIEAGGLRGRLVRLGQSVDEILNRHAYPDAVGRLLGQALALTGALAGALKFDGVFTLQTGGDGPIPMLVADFRSPGNLRGYAQFKPEALADVVARHGEDASVPRLLGAGHIAFTVDLGEGADSYQGIVALEGASLADCAHKYFRDSEQIDSAIRIAARRVENGDGGMAWRAGAVMLQRLPEGDPALIARGAEFERDEISDDDWRRAAVLLASVKDEELTAADLSPHQLLWRLFHEDGVRVFNPVPLTARCRCSEQRAHDVLANLPVDELKELAEAEKLTVNCEFCNATYVFALSDFTAPS